MAAALGARLLRAGAGEPSDGQRLFDTQCRACHDGNDARAPSLAAMRGRSPQAIVDALTSGSMRYQGLHLSGGERRAVAEFVAGRRVRGTVAGATIGRCGKPSPLDDPFAGLRMGAADDCRRTSVRRQSERNRVFARREERVRRVDVRRAGRRTDVDRDRRTLGRSLG
ncbi:MAG: hypothetical protein DMF99_19480 [Acidobacteria bacterium]|nr:MAG: hypothetical protein DMF99_19480 [Acidobacteriota bacterium]